MLDGMTDSTDGADGRYSCRPGTGLLIIGLAIIILSGLFLVVGLLSVYDETDRYIHSSWEIVPQIIGVMAGVVIAGTGYYFRSRK